MTNDLGNGESPSPVTNGAIRKRLSSIENPFSSAPTSTSVTSLERTESEEAELQNAGKDRLVEENQQLKQFKEKYHDVDLWFF